MSKKSCGPHAELASNEAVKITRCTCGTVHVTVNASGVTMRLAPEVFREVATGMRVAEVRFSETTEVATSGTQSIN